MNNMDFGTGSMPSLQKVLGRYQAPRAADGEIRHWSQFDRRIRSTGKELLGRLDEFPDAVLVSGCQRSGTTVVSKMILGTEGIDEYPGTDAELDGALILAGAREWSTSGRTCFQTTYLNGRYWEYFCHSGYRLIWVLRDPRAVVRSMLYNWRRGALTRLFRECGAELLPPAVRRRREMIGDSVVGSLKRACLAYNSKVGQVLAIRERLPAERFTIVDYDHMLAEPDAVLGGIAEFANLPGLERKGGILRRDDGQEKRLSAAQEQVVDDMCNTVYLEALRCCDGARRPHAQG